MSTLEGGHIFTEFRFKVPLSLICPTFTCLRFGILVIWETSCGSLYPNNKHSIDPCCFQLFTLCAFIFHIFISYTH